MQNQSVTTKIKRLPREVSDKIAAGEVIERPLSVVKELMENSIDANCTRIKVDIETGGQKTIIIDDDGSGMSKTDAELSLERFTTSKIMEISDLESINTLGFRGEALASICAISKMKIRTRLKDEETATEITAEAGEIKEIKETAHPKGSSIEVSELFYNLPARLKFLKSPHIETARIAELIGNYSLAFPDIHFIFNNNNNNIFSFPAQISTMERLRALWKINTNTQFHEISGEGPSFKFSGIFLPPENACSSRKHQVIFVNKRLIKDSMISQAVWEGYSPLIERGKFPMCLIFIDIDSSLLDVNVHPSKEQIKFYNSQEIFKIISGTIKNKFKEKGFNGDLFSAGFSIPKSQTYQKETYSKGTTYSTPYNNKLEEFLLPLNLDTIKETGIYNEEKPVKGEISPISFYQINKTFIIAVKSDCFWVIDQHTAHEQYNYKLLKEKQILKNNASQKLLIPQIIEISPINYSIIKEVIPIFTHLGFDVEEFGKHSIKISEVPLEFNKLSAENFIKELLEDVTNDLSAVSNDKRNDRLLKTIACKASVKAGDILSQKEMAEIYSYISKTDTLDPFCPHGRPIFYKFDQKELERLFKR